MGSDSSGGEYWRHIEGRRDWEGGERLSGCCRCRARTWVRNLTRSIDDDLDVDVDVDVDVDEDSMFISSWFLEGCLIYDPPFWTRVTYCSGRKVYRLEVVIGWRDYFKGIFSEGIFFLGAKEA